MMLPDSMDEETAPRYTQLLSARNQENNISVDFHPHHVKKHHFLCVSFVYLYLPGREVGTSTPSSRPSFQSFNA
jgi:hypothetical protein